MRSRRSVSRPGATALVLLTALMFSSACDATAPDSVPPGVAWAPAPVRLEGLSVLAEADAEGFRLHTASGDRTFLPGVDFSGDIPGGSATGVPTPTGDEYGNQLNKMGEMGIRVVRVYSLLPPEFYAALSYYNGEHPSAPLYLVQGVRTPDESYVAEGGTLYDPGADAAFTAELQDVSAAVHGALERDAGGGAAPLRWYVDVSRWLAGWVVGTEWDPQAIARTDEEERDAPYEPGAYFAATSEATATERWLARHLDVLAAAEHDRGVSVPISFVNWPTTDPLDHPEEPVASDDAVSIDAEHVLPTDDWPGGTFASFHAYPFYPDFLRHEPGLQATLRGGRPDPYAGYVLALREHFTSMPLVIAEVGVPASVGSAHRGPRGRDQGQHTEQEAMQINADLLTLVHDQGAAGAFISSWVDDWDRPSWNTAASRDSARRAYWQDPLTSEQWTGITKHDSDFVPGSLDNAFAPTGALRGFVVRPTASYVHLFVRGRGRMPGTMKLLVNTVPGGGADYRVVIDSQEGRARAYVRAELDPLRLYTDEDLSLQDSGKRWHLFRQLTNGSQVVGGKRLPAEVTEVGVLVQGDWDPNAASYNSLATWRPDPAKRSIRLRIPWSMLGLADPSSRLALGAGNPAEVVPVEALKLSVEVDGSTSRLSYAWPTWESTGVKQRPAAGSDVLVAAYRELAP